MKKQVIITVEILKTMLQNWNFGAQPVSIQYVTTPDWLNKATERMFPEVKKFANIGGMIGYSYENSVNNQLTREQKEADFISRPLWNGKGKRITSTLSTHLEKGTFYLTVKHQQTFRSLFVDMANLTVHANNTIRQYLKPYTPPKNQGVTEGKEIQHREISLDNIRRLKFKGTTYIVQG